MQGLILLLKETPGKKRIPPNDHQRRRLAVKGKMLGRTYLDGLSEGTDSGEGGTNRLTLNAI